jgi:hypothetical protein
MSAWRHGLTSRRATDAAQPEELSDPVAPGRSKSKQRAVKPLAMQRQQIVGVNGAAPPPPLRQLQGHVGLHAE